MKFDALKLRELAGEGFLTEFVEITDSTNLRLKKSAAEGAPEWSVLIAAAQTAGRGRLGRSFFSPPESGLYLSLLLRPERINAAELTAAAAVAAAAAADSLTGSRCEIKWVNDLLLNRRKVCGILAEGVTCAGKTAVVLGAGFNLAPPPGGFEGELKDKAGGLFEPGKIPPLARERLAAAFLREFRKIYLALPRRDFLGEYRARSAVVGREVTLLRQPEQTAFAEAIDDDFRLVVRFPDGRREALFFGDVSVKL